MWQARDSVNSSVSATFGRWNAGIYAGFCPWRYQTPVNYNMFCSFWTAFFCLDERITRWYLRVFQKLEDSDVNETL